MLSAVTAITGAIEALYVHLPQKKSAFGIDPIQQLNVICDIVPYFSDELKFFGTGSSKLL